MQGAAKNCSRCLPVSVQMCREALPDCCAEKGRCSPANRELPVLAWICGLISNGEDSYLCGAELHRRIRSVHLLERYRRLHLSVTSKRDL